MLCEKPFAITAADAAACFDAAEVADRLCIEGLMWRHHPQTRLAQQLVDDGAIGRLSHIRAALSVNVAPGDIRRIGKLGGGAVLDLGCYCISGIRLFGGQPLRVSAAQVVDTAEGADGGDLRLAATFALPGDALELIGTNGKSPFPTRGCADTATSSWNAAACPSDCQPTHPDGSDCPRISTTMMPIASSSRTPHCRSPAELHPLSAEPTRSTKQPRSRPFGRQRPPARGSPCLAPTAPNTSTHGEPS